MSYARSLSTPLAAAPAAEPMQTIDDQRLDPPPVVAEPPPVAVINPDVLRAIGRQLSALFEQYRADRQLAELRWLQNLRQYIGQYDPEIEAKLEPDRSQAYPRLTRVKCVSMLSRIMNLMFPGNEKNWTLTASPSPEMSPEDVQQAIQQRMQRDQEAGVQTAALTEEIVQEAVEQLARDNAKALEKLIEDQLAEVGGDQSRDYVALNRQVVQSGIRFGVGVLRGPFVREERRTTWVVDEYGQPTPQVSTSYKPQFEFLPVWDFYPDMAARSLYEMDGWFHRSILSRSQLRKLANRSDFFGSVIRRYISMYPNGNYKAQPFEQTLKSMGTRSISKDIKVETGRYEVIVWHGPVSAQMLRDAGADVPDEFMADDVEAEVWIIDDYVIKAEVNPWRKLGKDVRTVHTFVFDEDDTSPVGAGLPQVMRDSQMSVASATRMLLDNASVVCGPNLEINTDLLRPDQDLTSIHAYKIWYREGTGPEAQYPAVRNVSLDGHLPDLQKIIDMFMQMADIETFIGPHTGGEVQRGSGEPMRTAAGASMLRGEAALPFKDIVRNFDTFTQSVIMSLVSFNEVFNPTGAPPGDYNVIARGATSLIAKEVRGIQVDTLAATLTPQEMVHVDERKMVEARFSVRDMDDMLVSEDEVRRRKAAEAERANEQMEEQKRMIAAEVRKTLSDAYKNIAQGQKNAAAADAASVSTVLDMLERAMAVSSGPETEEEAPDGEDGAYPGS